MPTAYPQVSARSITLIILCFASICMVDGALAQQAPTAAPQVSPNPSSGASGVVHQIGLSNFFSARTPYKFCLTLLVCTTGIITMSLMLWSITRIGSSRPDDLTRPIIVVSIIMGTLVLVIAGFSNEQIAPAFGLFGTIVGYMLGRMSS